MLFDFKLRPIDEIAPWTGADGLLLSWFGLTDGFYRLNVGSERLFSYSPQAAKLMAEKYPGGFDDYVDYQVARLWEDMLDILPDALAPIPPQLAELLSGPNPKVVAWFNGAYKWRATLEVGPEADTEEDRYFEAISWLNQRNLDSLYLKAGPNVWVWSTLDTVTITWDNRELKFEGVERWSASCGSFSLSRDTFIEEVRAFDRRLIDEMAVRVREVCAHWDRPEVRIDFAQLRAEQLERAGAFQAALSKAPKSVDWKKVLAAVNHVTGRQD